MRTRRLLAAATLAALPLVAGALQTGPSGRRPRPPARERPRTSERPAMELYRGGIGAPCLSCSIAACGGGGAPPVARSWPSSRRRQRGGRRRANGRTTGERDGLRAPTRRPRARRRTRATPRLEYAAWCRVTARHGAAYNIGGNRAETKTTGTATLTALLLSIGDPADGPRREQRRNPRPTRSRPRPTRRGRRTARAPQWAPRSVSTPRNRSGGVSPARSSAPFSRDRAASPAASLERPSHKRRAVSA